MAVGGAAYLVSKAIKTAKVVGFEDLGMEAIYEFDVVDMPVTVAVDAAAPAPTSPARPSGLQADAPRRSGERLPLGRIGKSCLRANASQFSLQAA